MRIVLHAGMDKTGTTTVQKAMASNEGRLREGGVLYPRAGRYRRDVNHLALARGLTPDPSAIPTPLPPPPLDWRGSVQALHREIEEADPRITLLSCEAFWIPRAFPADALARLADALAPHEVEVVVYLRPAGSYLQSSYAQAVRGPQRSRLDFEAHVRMVIDSGMVNYDARIAEFRHAVGRDHVHVRRYSPHGAGTLGSMLDLIDAPHLARDAVTKRNANARASRTGLHLYRLANRARMPRRVLPWTLEPLDRLWKSAAAASEAVRRFDARIDPIDPERIRALDAAHPLPEELRGDRP